MSDRTPRRKRDPTPLEKMREFTRHLVAVPKSEITKRKARKRRAK